MCNNPVKMRRVLYWRIYQWVDISTCIRIHAAHSNNATGTLPVMITQFSTQGYQGQGYQGKGQGHRTLSYQHTTYKGCLSRQVEDLLWQSQSGRPGDRPTALDLRSVTLCLPNRVTNHKVDLGRQTQSGVLTVANLRADVGWWTKGQT